MNKTEPKTAVKTGRVQWIDFAKGIAILATILGHTADVGKTGSDVRALIFSFHMPLFFILSILTYRCSNSLEEYKMKQKKAAKHLLVPAVVVFAIATAIECVQDTTLLTQFEYWQEKLYTFIIGSGTSVEYSGISVAAFGIAWFFFALFIGRAIFDYIHLSMKEDSQILVVSMIVGAIGMIWGMLMQLPFSLDIALAIMPVFLLGLSDETDGSDEVPIEKGTDLGCDLDRDIDDYRAGLGNTDLSGAGKPPVPVVPDLFYYSCGRNDVYQRTQCYFLQSKTSGKTNRVLGQKFSVSAVCTHSGWQLGVCVACGRTSVPHGPAALCGRYYRISGSDAGADCLEKNPAVYTDKKSTNLCMIG